MGLRDMPRPPHGGAVVGQPGHHPLAAQDVGQDLDIADTVLQRQGEPVGRQHGRRRAGRRHGRIGIDEHDGRVDRRNVQRTVDRAHRNRPGRIRRIENKP